MNLAAISSVGEEEAQTLRDNGISYLEDLAGARPIHIEKLGFDPQIVADALIEVDHPDVFIDPDDIEYTCEHCGEEYAGIQSYSFDKHVKSGCEARPGASANPFGGSR